MLLIDETGLKVHRFDLLEKALQCTERIIRERIIPNANAFPDCPVGIVTDWDETIAIQYTGVEQLSKMKETFELSKPPLYAKTKEPNYVLRTLVIGMIMKIREKYNAELHVVTARPMFVEDNNREIDNVVPTKEELKECNFPCDELVLAPFQHHTIKSSEIREDNVWAYKELQRLSRERLFCFLVSFGDKSWDVMSQEVMTHIEEIMRRDENYSVDDDPGIFVVHVHDPVCRKESIGIKLNCFDQT